MVDGAKQLAPEDFVLLKSQIDVVRERLVPSAPADDLLERLGVELELVTDTTHAREVVEGLPATVGFDIESEPLPEHAPPPIWLAITKSGRLAVRQPTARTRLRSTRTAPGRGWPRSTTRAPGWSTWSTFAPCQSPPSRVCGRAG